MAVNILLWASHVDMYSRLELTVIPLIKEANLVIELNDDLVRHRARHTRSIIPAITRTWYAPLEKPLRVMNILLPKPSGDVECHTKEKYSIPRFIMVT